MLIIAVQAADLWGLIVRAALVWEVPGLAVRAPVVGETTAAQVAQEVGLGTAKRTIMCR